MDRTQELAAKLKQAKATLGFALKSEATPRFNAMLESARSEPRIPILPAQMDGDHMLLNVLNGTIDLRNGTLRAHRREDLITKLAPVEYDETATCPNWQRFLLDVFLHDMELVRYMQKVLGYCLTGNTKEQILLIFWGKGSNGKSTLINTFLAMLGEDYAIKASRDLFMAKKQDSHPAQIARLFGKRMVVAVETHEGARLDEGLVKELTGDDPITARRMKENPWQFNPTHKAVLVTNHKPEIRGTDEGIWRRPRLIPFGQRFWNPDDPAEVANGLPEELRQDKELPNRLMEEVPGILRWCVDGCLAWQREGLGMPKMVKEATSAYRTEQDLVSSFLAESCVVGTDYRVRAGDLYGSYRQWCERVHEAPVSQRRFGETMTEREFQRVVSNGTWYRGLALRQTECEETTE